ncbi:AraC family transcriptional regulator [Paenibacillus caseinilyticus]|uniref:AraC family transcriptional regulator n=1 Tax=Paenibacillus mucilaginosus K02 TaxID=997761 RepID=I0BKN7_9BACL|nr:AraC family transcriptional regulator [Paenibacillus mucilaginosus]AFH62934.1 AraC family transcriptional regulator [Paenibacillus mucilaginosus K02]
MNSDILHFISPPIPYFVDCGYASYRSGDHHIDRSGIGVFDLIVVIKGSLPMAENGREWLLREGEGLILRPDGHHYGPSPCQQDTEIIWIHFQTFGSWQECRDLNECLDKQSELTASHRVKAYLNHAEVSSIFIPKTMSLSGKAREVLSLFFEQEHEPQSMRNWKRQAYFQLFLQHLDRDLASPSDTAAIHLAEKIEVYIRQNYSREITNTQLQKELNYHPNYMAKCMLKIYGVTPMAFLLQFRIEQSKRLLVQTTWPVARIAEEVGFRHLSHYSTCFSRKEGLSPSAFRSKFTRNQ